MPAPSAHITSYWRDDITSALRRRGVRLQVVTQVQRGASGTNLLVVGYPPNVQAPIAVFANPARLKTEQSPSVVCFLGGAETIGGWLSEDGERIQLANGDSLLRPNRATFDVDPQGRYFVFGESKSKTWLGRVSAPAERQLISDELLGTTVLSSGNQVYVCGVAGFTDPRTGGVEDGTKCLVYEDDGQNFKLLDRHEFPWAAGVCDLDTLTGALLVQGKGKLSPPLYLYDPHTRTQRRVGTAKEFNFFFSEDPL